MKHEVWMLALMAGLTGTAAAQVAMPGYAQPGYAVGGNATAGRAYPGVVTGPAVAGDPFLNQSVERQARPNADAIRAQVLNQVSAEQLHGLSAESLRFNGTQPVVTGSGYARGGDAIGGNAYGANAVGGNAYGGNVYAAPGRVVIVDRGYAPAYSPAYPVPAARGGNIVIDSLTTRRLNP